MSRTVECPKCGSLATVVERTKDFKYVLECKNCGRFEITGSEERTARLHGQKIPAPSLVRFRLGTKVPK
jgi:uncharacterized Zn finger protein